MFPWSVIPIAGICSRSTSASSGVIFAAPSSIEYSVWLCRCTKDWFIGTPVYDRPPTHPRRVAECVYFLSVELDELLQRLLHVSLDCAGRRRTHRAEQRTSAHLDTQAQGGPAFGGPHSECDAVFRSALAGSRHRDLVRRVPFRHRPRHPVAQAFGTRHAHDLDAFADLVGQLAAPPLVQDEPLAPVRQVRHVLPHVLWGHRHVGGHVDGGHRLSVAPDVLSHRPLWPLPGRIALTHQKCPRSPFVASFK